MIWSFKIKRDVTCKMKKKFSIKERLKSFTFAFAGLKLLLLEEHNAFLHVAATFLVVALGFYFRLNQTEWIAIIMCIGAVFSLELVNTSIETLADHITPEKHDKIKKVKDLAAGAVLVAAMMAVVVALLIFIPKL